MNNHQPAAQIPPLPPAVRDFAGLPFRQANLVQATEWICQEAHSSSDGGDIHLLNAYSISVAERDPDYRKDLSDAYANFADGKPIEWLTKFSRHPISQVRGPALFEAVLDRGRASGLKHFFLGSTPETLELLRAESMRKFPGIKIVGTFSPPFRQLREAEITAQDDLIRDSKADIVWVGLGTPKQDREAARLSLELNLLAVAVGAAFDFTAGTKQQAPLIIQGSGLEWIHRLLVEPRRLWKRYTFGNMLFVAAVAKRSIEKLADRRSQSNPPEL